MSCMKNSNFYFLHGNGFRFLFVIKRGRKKYKERIKPRLFSAEDWEKYHPRILVLADDEHSTVAGGFTPSKTGSETMVTLGCDHALIRSPSGKDCGTGGYYCKKSFLCSFLPPSVTGKQRLIRANELSSAFVPEIDPVVTGNIPTGYRRGKPSAIQGGLYYRAAWTPWRLLSMHGATNGVGGPCQYTADSPVVPLPESSRHGRTRIT